MSMSEWTLIQPSQDMQIFKCSYVIDIIWHLILNLMGEDFQVGGLESNIVSRFLSQLINQCKIVKYIFRLERDLYSRTDQFGVEMRERAKADIREAMVGTETFEPKHVIVAT